MIPYRNTHPLTSPVNNIIYDLPAPTNISLLWNMGSILGLCLITQITTGLLLTIHYTPHTLMAFNALAHINREVNIGWLINYTHINGASIIFLSMYLHIGRSIYFNSFNRTETWNLGVMIYILTIATAFIGYLLPWGQISFWGATVITNMFSAIPYIGGSIVIWLWGGFAVSNPTLNRFFTLHFLLPFVIALTAILHLVFLHSQGSNNPLGVSASYNNIPFHPFFTWNDIYGFIPAIFTITFIVLTAPNLLNDPENFIPANPLATPPHIKPEWYFLWAYAILRSIPNNLGGVIVIFAAILILFTLPYVENINSTSTSYPSQVQSWSLLIVFALLTWVGNNSVEEPFSYMGAIITTLYFIIIITFTLPEVLLHHKPLHYSTQNPN